MGFFDGFSSRPEADSAASQKRDDKADPGLRKAAFSAVRDRIASRDRTANGGALETC
jgi:hypothetical protein